MYDPDTLCVLRPGGRTALPLHGALQEPHQSEAPAGVQVAAQPIQKCSHTAGLTGHVGMSQRTLRGTMEGIQPLLAQLTQYGGGILAGK